MTEPSLRQDIDILQAAINETRPRDGVVKASRSALQHVLDYLTLQPDHETLRWLESKYAQHREGKLGPTGMSVVFIIAIGALRAALASPREAARRSCDPREHGGKHAPWCPVASPREAAPDDSRFHRKDIDHCVQCREPWPCPWSGEAAPDSGGTGMTDQTSAALRAEACPMCGRRPNARLRKNLAAPATQEGPR